MDLYAENILDHYRHPRAKGVLDSPSVSHEEVNASCGDTLTVQLKFDGEAMKDVAWSGTGCAISQAAMSLLAGALVGKNSTDIESMKPSEVYELLGVPIGPRRVKCALLCLHAIKNAIKVYKREEAQSWIQTIAE